MCADAERWLAACAGIFLNGNGAVGVESIAENHLFSAWIDAERAVFAAYLVELLIVIAAVHAQALE